MSSFSRTMTSLHLSALALGLFFLSACGKEQDQGRPPVPVSAAKVLVKQIPVYVESIGSLSSLQSVNIVPQVSGKIEKIHFKQGADVKNGQLLFSIDPRPYQALLHDAEAKLAKNEAELALSQETLQRWTNLQSSNYVSKQELDSLKAKLRGSQAAVQGDKAAIETAKINLDYCSIKSPLDGIAGTYNVDEGNVVSALSQPPLVNVQQIDQLYVDFTLPEAELGNVQKALANQGQLPVEVTSLTNASISGIADLKYIDNQVEQGSGTVKLRAVLPNNTRAFWPGQSVRVKVFLQQLPNAKLIPFPALQYGQQGPFVFTITPNQTAEIKVVRPGQRHGDLVAILAGVEEGDTVVVTGHLMLAPGAGVIVIPPQGMPQKAPISPEQAAAEKK